MKCEPEISRRGEALRSTLLFLRGSADPLARTHQDAGGCLPDGQSLDMAYSTEAIVYMFAYSMASSTLLLINKLCLHYLPMPSFISTLQFISAGVTPVVLMATGNVPWDRWEWVKVKAYLYYVGMFVATIYCNMKVCPQLHVDITSRIPSWHTRDHIFFMTPGPAVFQCGDDHCLPRVRTCRCLLPRMGFHGEGIAQHALSCRSLDPCRRCVLIRADG
jgi:hypothetical protein